MDVEMRSNLMITSNKEKLRFMKNVIRWILTKI